MSSNKIWWLCLVPTLTTRFASDVGYRMAKKIMGLYKEIIFMNNDIKFLKLEWRTTSRHKFWRPFWIACLSYFFRLQYVWFPVHLYTVELPNSSGHLAELIVHIIALGKICIVTRSYWLAADCVTDHRAHSWLEWVVGWGWWVVKNAYDLEVPLKLHTKYLTHTYWEICILFIGENLSALRFKSSSHTVAILSASGSRAVKESCAPIGWKDSDSVMSQ